MSSSHLVTKLMSVFDCFTFFNELDLLKVRLELLNDSVDYYVIVESNLTHSGLKKDYYIEDNWQSLSNWHSKIIYIKINQSVDEVKNSKYYTGNSLSWALENQQRDSISDIKENVSSDDLIMIGDLDELPNPSTILHLKQTGLKEAHSLVMLLHYYYMNCKSVGPEAHWNGTVVCSGDIFKQTNAQLLRNNRNIYPKIEYAGYHFSYLGGVEKVIAKIQSFAHTEYNREEIITHDYIEQCLDNGKDIFGRANVEYVFTDINEYPEVFRNIMTKYPNFLNSKKSEKMTIIIYTQSKDKLVNILDYIESKYEKSNIRILLGCKDYMPWTDDAIRDRIINFGEYLATPTSLEPVEFVIQSIQACKTESILVLDESWPKRVCDDTSPINRRELMSLNLDHNYETINWFLIDINTQISKEIAVVSDVSKDCIRYTRKVESPYFFKKIIYIDGGLGDHVMSLPLLYKVGKDRYICCKYKFIYEHIDKLGFIDWTDELFGGYKRNVYGYGSSNNSQTIIDAFFGMYGVIREDNDILKYEGMRQINLEFENKDNLALICTSAAKINGLDSNKDWSDINWFKLVNKLKSSGHFVIQVGSINDNQIPNVDAKFLDKPIENLAGLIENSRVWISVDTFFHHFASAISPKKGICLTPYYNDHAKHEFVNYIEKDCGLDFSSRKWWLDLQQPERKKCMSLIRVDEVHSAVENISMNVSSKETLVEFIIPTYNRVNELRLILSSLVCQTDDSWSAHIVIDDTYNKEIIDLVNTFKSDKIYYSTLDRNYNDFGHTPRNYGKNMCKARYVIMTGDDNYYVPTFVTELREAAKENPVIIYYDMIHNHLHYNTQQPYQYWRPLLIVNGVDIGGFALRNDVAKKHDLTGNHSADGLLIENILSDVCDNYIDYREKVNNTHVESVSLEGIKKIDKVLYVHN